MTSFKFSKAIPMVFALLAGSVSSQAIAHDEGSRHYRSDKPLYYCYQGHCYRASDKQAYQPKHHGKKYHKHSHRDKHYSHRHRNKPKVYTGIKLGPVYLANGYYPKHSSASKYRHKRYHANQYKRKYRADKKHRHHWHGQRKCYVRHRNAIVIKL